VPCARPSGVPVIVGKPATPCQSKVVGAKQLLDASHCVTDFTCECVVEVPVL